MNATNPFAQHAPDDRLSRQQTADVLGISIRRLQQLRDAGEITPEVNTATRRVRYRFSEVERVRVHRSESAWSDAEDGRSAPTAPAPRFRSPGSTERGETP